MGPTPGSQDAHFDCSTKRGKPQCSFGNPSRTCLGQFNHQNTFFGIMTKNYALLLALLLFCMPNACLAARSNLDAINYTGLTGSQNGTVGDVAMGLATSDVARCNGALWLGLRRETWLARWLAAMTSSSYIRRPRKMVYCDFLAGTLEELERRRMHEEDLLSRSVPCQMLGLLPDRA